MNPDTICAISTPPGTGGIAVLRVSGPQAIAIAEQLTGSQLLKSVQLRRIPDIDDTIITVFHAPNSYTGDDIVELSCHGSLYIQQTLLRRLIALGARLAEPGEFTRRAFLNGKMDLSQAEAVADLIAAETQSAHTLALHQLKGDVAQSIRQLREQLLHFTSLIELELDFADHEDLEFADRSQLNRLAQQIDNHLTVLINSFRLGNALKNGVKTAIIGATNVGKSTLLNTLIGEDRAIVSDINGTTRDTIEATANIGGVLFRFIDTAGLRRTDDPIEQLGQQRTQTAAQTADIVLYVADAREKQKTPDTKIHLTTQNTSILIVYNKTDLLTSPPIPDKEAVYISAKTGDITQLTDRLQQLFPTPDNRQNTLVSNERHYSSLCRAREAIRKVKTGLQDNLSGELLSIDLQDCLRALGEITGQITSTEVLHTVFSRFCIGK